MRKQKILLVHNYYQQPGGEDHVLAAELALLQRYGHQVEVYTRHNDEVNQVAKPVLAAQTLFNRQVYRDLRRTIEQTRAEVVHIHNTLPLVSPAAHYAAKAQGATVVQTLHNYRLFCPAALLWRDGFICQDCVGKAVPFPAVRHSCYRDSRMASGTVAAMLALHRALRTWHRKVDAFIAPSEFARSKLIQCGLPSESVIAKPHFVDPDPGIGSGEGAFGLFVGRLAPGKGIRALVAAAERIAPIIPLAVVGQGPLEPVIREAADRIGRFSWLGPKPVEEVYDLMGAACFLVVPSDWYEIFGRVAIEALSKGTPVIAARIGALTELVQHGSNGLLFEPSSADDLVRQIEWYVAHPDRWPAMRTAARRSFEEQYTASLNYDLLMDVYGRAVENHRCRIGA